MNRNKLEILSSKNRNITNSKFTRIPPLIRYQDFKENEN